MIDDLKKNIDNEIEILKEISLYSNKLMFTKDKGERRLLEDALSSLKNTLRIINNSVPDLLNEIQGVKKLSGVKKKESLQKVSFSGTDKELIITIDSDNRTKLLEELSISENLIRRLKNKESSEEKFTEFKSARGYLKLSNKFCLGFSNDLIQKGKFKSISLQIKKANIDILFETYVSMMLFTTFLSIFVGIFLTFFFFFFDLSFDLPFFILDSGPILDKLLEVIYLPILVPVLTFFAIYFYPITERASISKKIEQELPFAVIQMSAISGSGIPPSEIFRVIGLNKDYPNLRKEIRKVLNQINLYGYDLVTALNNVSRTTPSEKLSELFSGLGTTINSGGDLKEFFEKRAETLLVSYRLEREKYAKTAETFMDIYISVVIAAPMILMLLLIMMGVSGINASFSPLQMTFIIISLIALVNVIFLVFLRIKQPAY